MMVLLADKVIAPLYVLVPSKFNAPRLLTPDPEICSGLAISTPSETDKVAPLATTVLPAVVPKALFWSALSVPAEIVVAPV